MLKAPDFRVNGALKSSLLEVRYFAEAVHIQLADERVEILVLEPPTKKLVCESFVVHNYIARSDRDSAKGRTLTHEDVSSVGPPYQIGVRFIGNNSLKNN